MDYKALNRFTEKVKISQSGCHIWQGWRCRQGYGRFKLDGKMELAHRVAYTHYVGNIPDGLVIDHLCRNTSCVNLNHLEVVTQRINCRRGEVGKWQKEKEICKNGHPFNEENTYNRSDGGRACRVCGRIAQRKRYYKVRG